MSAFPTIGWMVGRLVGQWSDNREKIKDYLRFLTHAGETRFPIFAWGNLRKFCDLYGPDVDINTKNSLDNSGSNETVQKVLASIV